MTLGIPQMEFATVSRAPAWVGDNAALSKEEKALKRFSLDDKSVVITGGARGLGLDAAFAMLEHGAPKVALLDINEPNGLAAVAHLEKFFPGADIVFKQVNITDAEMVDAVINEITESFGKIDVLLCFAGIVNCEPAVEHSAETFRRLLDVNTTGTFLVSKAVAKSMISKKNGGSIIMTASISAHGSNFPQPQIAYNASKAAVLGIKSTMATELAVHGIRVNSISPGYMDTVLNEGDALNYHRQKWYQRTPLGRMGARGELNGAIVLLASDAGSFITGSDILIDGGISSVM
ncbi:hypothetical protein V1511DRAFT_474708 [Dipodascopsis uninucleata]